ncbi:hypothetical protein B4U80_07873 [Leptotrombidium deliense]|uniref:RRM domain-containing protein n=1 Tax=Leptotrombidium deliense TaxID=299467 RepID=A0A443STW0_9ACAR|nr:hypothetical protein B4U80_07873 [Leptotrombidium deliense]
MSSGYENNSQSQLNEDKSNLIINYLPQTLSDEEFRNIFERIGPLKSARIIRNRQTNYSFGFGFVNYVNLRDAELAIHQLNGFQLQHKRIKVAFSRPHCNEIKKAKLYVKNVPLHYSEQDLESHFSKYGKIIQCRLLNGDSKTKGVAFILFDLHQQAEKAIKNLNGVLLPGALYPLEIKYATDNKNRSWNSFGVNYPNIRSLPLPNHGFSSGPIRSNEFSKNNNRYNPFINQYLRITDELDSPNSQSLQNNILFVYNIGPQIDENALYTLFVKFGPVVRAQVMRNGNAPRGYGFVKMNSYEDAVNAIKYLNGFNFQGKSIQVDFKR